MKLILLFCLWLVALLSAEPCVGCVCLAAPIVFQDVEELEEQAIAAAVAKVAPSVIRFETIGGNNRVDGRIVANGPSTGVVVSKDGYVVSASFHFAHNPASILTTLPDGSKAAAEIVGRDKTRKIVLLKIDTESEFTPIEATDFSGLQVGQTVVAIGRVFDAKEPNVSTGIVSAKNRVWSKAIQTDAKISPANFGGPLTDLAGKVIGILVPMSPDDGSEMAGTEWYDSGIGFAVPLADIMTRFEDLKSGKTLRAGLLGVSLKGTDVYADPAVVAFAGPNTPAGKAGVLEGDEITRVNGQNVGRQSELKHALGPLYERDSVELVVKRGDEEKSFSVELVGELEPFVAPAIGLLLETDQSKAIVEYVANGSNAESSGLKAGDQIVKFGGTLIEKNNELRDAILKTQIGSMVSVSVERNGKEQNFEVAIEKQSANLFEGRVGGGAEREYRVVRIQVAESANKCFAIVPVVLEEDRKPSLLVWVPGPGKLSKKAMEKVWPKRCQNSYSIVLIPESSDEKKWQPDDIAFVQSAVENLSKQFAFEKSKVVVAGSKTGGTMASLIAFANRSQIKGLAMIDAGASSRIADFSTSPVEPLLVLLGSQKESPDESVQDSADGLKQAEFPVHLDKRKQNLEQWIEDVLDWAWTVDRI